MKELTGNLKFGKGGGGDGNTALPRRKLKNKRVDRPARNRADREAEAVPTSVKWALNNPRVTKHRFTPLQWAILEARYPRCHCGCGAFNEGVNSSVAVGRILNRTGDSKMLREYEEEAHRIAYEMCYAWQAAYEKWTRIKSKRPFINPHNGEPEQLDTYERKLLAKYRRTDKPKKGRTVVEPYEVGSPYEDVMDTQFDENGQSHRRYENFSEMFPGKQREEGVPEQFKVEE